MGFPKRIALTLLFILIIVSSTFILLEKRPSGITKSADVSFIIRTETEYLNNGSEAWNMSEMDMAINLFMNNSFQTVSLSNHSHPIRSYKTDEDGNPYAVLDLPSSTLNPGSSLRFTVEYKATYKERPRYNLTVPSGYLDDIPEKLVAEYCRNSDNWQLSNPTLKELAFNLTSGETEVLTIVENFVAWIRENIQYKVDEYPLYPNETYTYRSGDCDDQAILFISLCRIVGVPAYLQLGCIYISDIGNSTVWNEHVTFTWKNIGWHGWAMAYIPPWGWLPVDLTWGFGPSSNAIEYAALITEKTFQLMNVSNQDYIESSREMKSLVLKKNLYITEREEMNQISPEKVDLYILPSTLKILKINLCTALIPSNNRRETRCIT